MRPTNTLIMIWMEVFTDGVSWMLKNMTRHKRKMKYSDDLDYILKEHVKILVD